MKKMTLKQKLIGVAFDFDDWLANHTSIKKIHKKHKKLFKTINKQNEQYNEDMALAKKVTKENYAFQKKLKDKDVVIFYPNGSSIRMK